ncbi:P-loop ATPase, Sll1717 family [Streptomyces sp. NPDC096032]|uniref:P-loop ATPase, Sll1717 family n=1 Tax=Streptomyces sp. NPDC096032 TaxID=3366070 RepID=UPI0037F36862
MSNYVIRPAALSQLDFGAPAAERDIERGLEDYFVESEAYRRVSSGEKTIILGNRGSGKSAIFQVLAKRAKAAGNHVISLAPEDYSYELLSKTMAAEGSGSWAKLGAYAVAWKYLIYVLVMKEVSRKGMRLRKGAASKIYKYVRDNHSTADMSKLSALISYLKRLEGIKIGKYEAGVKTRELEKLYKLEEIHHLLPALQEVLAKEKVYVLVDELDRGWDSSEDAQSFVAGLFQACVSINTLHPNLRVYVSLRQELYDNIPALYEDAQKYRDLLETIDWTEEALLSLITKRMRHSLDSLSRIREDDECWGAVFSSVLGYRRNRSFNYMVDRTLYRPREIIQFCTQAVEAAQDGSTVPPIDYPVISTAENVYSGERAKDIAAEYRFQYPGLLEVFEAFRGKIYTFDRDELELLCLELIAGEIRVDGAEGWLERCDPDSLIEILWHVGFLRAQVVGGIRGRRRSGSQYVGPYQVQFLNVAAATRFQVHPMFRASLGMKEPKGNRSNRDDASPA